MEYKSKREAQGLDRTRTEDEQKMRVARREALDWRLRQRTAKAEQGPSENVLRKEPLRELFHDNRRTGGKQPGELNHRGHSYDKEQASDAVSGSRTFTGKFSQTQNIQHSLRQEEAKQIGRAHV